MLRVGPHFFLTAAALESVKLEFEVPLHMLPGHQQYHYCSHVDRFVPPYTVYADYSWSEVVKRLGSNYRWLVLRKAV